MSKKKKPFHLSVVQQLKTAENRMSKHQIGLFIGRFAIEVSTIATTIVATEIPREFAVKLALELRAFYKEFQLKYPRHENGLGGKYDWSLIHKSFTNAISSLCNRKVAA